MRASVRSARAGDGSDREGRLRHRPRAAVRPLPCRLPSRQSGGQARRRAQGVQGEASEGETQPQAQRASALLQLDLLSLCSPLLFLCSSALSWRLLPSTTSCHRPTVRCCRACLRCCSSPSVSSGEAAALSRPARALSSSVLCCAVLEAYTVDMLVHSKLFIDAARQAGVKHVVVSDTAATTARPLHAPRSSSPSASSLRPLLLSQHLGVDLPGSVPLRVVIWHHLIERSVRFTRATLRQLPSSLRL